MPIWDLTSKNLEADEGSGNSHPRVDGEKMETEANNSNLQMVAENIWLTEGEIVRFMGLPDPTYLGRTRYSRIRFPSIFLTTTVNSSNSICSFSSGIRSMQSST